MDTGVHSGGLKLTSHSDLLPRLRMNGAMNLPVLPTYILYSHLMFFQLPGEQLVFFIHTKTTNCLQSFPMVYLKGMCKNVGCISRT